MPVALPGLRKVLAWGVMPATALAISLAYTSAVSAATPFDKLFGSWGGSGLMRLEDGTTRRMRCNTYYTGRASQLGMVVRCTGDNDNKIEIRSRLSYSGGRLSGQWEERTYNARGRVSGTAGDNRINLNITGGGLTGRMAVSLSGSRQNVNITTQGIPLKSVTITLARQR
ncbi:MAG: hypothetical protein ACOC8P_03245 [Dichotomicrobium sp.]